VLRQKASSIKKLLSGVSPEIDAEFWRETARLQRPD
jgi:hypothetical protein